MIHLRYYIKMALKPRAKNIICILSLALGLALSLILFGNVLYEKSFDNFHEKGDRIYLIKAHHYQNQKAGAVYDALPIAVVHKIFTEIPEVEMATQFYDRSYEYTLNNTKFLLNVMEVDSLFFDIFSFEVLHGEPKLDFKDPTTIYLSQSKAAELFGGANPIGKGMIKGKRTLVVRGVYKDFPANSIITKKYGPVEALESFAKYKIRGGWAGGDRYKGMVLLRDGVSEDMVEAKIQVLSEKELDPSESWSIQYKLLPLADDHANSPAVKQTTLIISFLALLLIIVSALNNSLISISAMSTRLKEIAIHKCSGASKERVMGMIFAETVVHTIMALGLAVFLIFSFETQIAQLFAPIEMIFALENIWSAGVVILFMLVVSSIIPCMIFSNIPVVALFVKSNNSNQLWKKTMLFFQLFFAILFISIAFIALRQYNYMLHKDLGYSYENLIYTRIELKRDSDFDKYTEELNSLSCVEQVSYSREGIVMNYLEGIGVSDVAGGVDFSCRGLISTSAIFDMHEMVFVDGAPFRDESNNMSEVVVNERFVEMMNWDVSKSAVGNTFRGGYGNSVIVGVVKNFETTRDISSSEFKPLLIQTLRPFSQNPDEAGFLRFNFPRSFAVIIRLTEITPENIELVRAKLLELNPENDEAIDSYMAFRDNLMSPFEKIATGFEIVGLIILLISAMGIFGYIGNELQFKYREIALRKVYGATIANVILMVYNPIVKLLYLAVPLALVISYFGGKMLIERNFTDTIQISWWMLLLPVLFVVVFTLVIVVARTFRVASEDPVKAINK